MVSSTNSNSGDPYAVLRRLTEMAVHPAALVLPAVYPAHGRLPITIKDGRLAVVPRAPDMFASSFVFEMHIPAGCLPFLTRLHLPQAKGLPTSVSLQQTSSSFSLKFWACSLSLLSVSFTSPNPSTKPSSLQDLLEAATSSSGGKVALKWVCQMPDCS